MSNSVKFNRGQFFVGLYRLSSWFGRSRRILPWREQPTLYRVWVSEIMLQQTQVATVIPYFERFIARFPTVETLAAAPEEEVLRLWAGLGYYSRARNLHRTARRIVYELGTPGAPAFPKTRAEWLEMPGVGEYTAGAILSIALDQPEAVLDGNVERVLSRLRRISDKKLMWRYSRAIVKTARRLAIPPSVTNQALMELGATVCTPRKPGCSVCPLFDLCKACAHGEEERYPLPKAARGWVPVEEELHCVVDGNGHILLSERDPGQWRAGLWDLVEWREAENLKREAATTALGSVQTRHVVTNHKILRTTHVWKVSDSRGTSKRPKPAAATKAKAPAEKKRSPRWVSINEPEVAVGSALRRTLAKIREKFPGALQ